MDLMKMKCTETLLRVTILCNVELFSNKVWGQAMGWRQFTILLILFFSLSAPLRGQQTAGWELVADGLQFPEGPAWAADSILYVSNCNGDWLARIQNGKMDTLLLAGPDRFQRTNGLAALPDNWLLACDFGLGAILRISPGGEVETLVPGYRGIPFNRPNDLALVGDGRFYFSDPKSYGKDKPDGRVFYFHPDSSDVLLAADSLCFPNGIARSPRDGKLYLSESAQNRILRFDIAADARLVNAEVFAELPGGDPDGLEFDRDGNLYVAHFGGSAVYCFAPDGTLREKIPAPGKKPSNLEFGGPDGRTLFLTEDESNAVYRLRK